MALINHANISLTLLYLSWQNPALPALHRLAFSRCDCANSWWWWSGSLCCPLALLELQASHLGPAPMTLVFLPARHRGAWVSLPMGLPHLPRGPPGAVSGLQLGSFCRMLAAGPRPGALNTSAKHRAKTDSLSHKAGWLCGCCRTCFWAKSSNPTLMCVYSHEESMCALREVGTTWRSILIGVRYCLRNNMLSGNQVASLSGEFGLLNKVSRSRGYIPSALLPCSEAGAFLSCRMLLIHLCLLSPASVRRFWKAFTP